MAPTCQYFKILSQSRTDGFADQIHGNVVVLSERLEQVQDHFVFSAIWHFSHWRLERSRQDETQTASQNLQMKVHLWLRAIYATRVLERQILIQTFVQLIAN